MARFFGLLRGKTLETQEAPEELIGVWQNIWAKNRLLTDSRWGCTSIETPPNDIALSSRGNLPPRSLPQFWLTTDPRLCYYKNCCAIAPLREGASMPKAGSSIRKMARERSHGAFLRFGAAGTLGKAVIHKANRRQKVVKTLQRKGTRSATRRLISMSVWERRFVADTNHCLAKKITTPGCLIGLEDLTHIRERATPYPLGRGEDVGKKASIKQRRANRNQAKWSFAELHSFIDYEAVLVVSLAIKVDADYTSQGCCK